MLNPLKWLQLTDPESWSPTQHSWCRILVLAGGVHLLAWHCTWAYWPQCVPKVYYTIKPAVGLWDTIPQLLEKDGSLRKGQTSPASNIAVYLLGRCSPHLPRILAGAAPPQLPWFLGCHYVATPLHWLQESGKDLPWTAWKTVLLCRCWVWHPQAIPGFFSAKSFRFPPPPKGNWVTLKIFRIQNFLLMKSLGATEL